MFAKSADLLQNLFARLIAGHVLKQLSVLQI
jgi:hypothetical protein